MNFVISFLLILLTALIQAQPTLRFKSPITTNMSRLGDVLSIAPDESQWASIPLDSRPKANTVLTKQQVINWLESKIGRFDYQWEGKNTALITASSQTTSQELTDKAEKTLRKQLRKYQLTSLEVSVKSKLPNSELALETLKPQVKISYPPLKQICVHLIDGKHSIPVWFKVKAYQKILVAKQNIDKHNTINNKEFILKNSNIAGLKNRPYTKLPNTLWLKKSIKKNAILTEDYLSPKPQILKGQTVHVTVKNQAISISTQATALHDAYLGQPIKVMNEQSNKPFIAIVTAPNKAEVQE